tara:strand:+ start:920 stop:1579 length:660 start_codon:yes stop_codon:yes gene_type:complete
MNIYTNYNKCYYNIKCYNNKCYINKCKNNNTKLINNNYYCKNHSILFFNKYIIKIQKIYRAYKSRKILKNIYYKLPQDIQKQILFYINESLYQKKYNRTIRNIINKRTYNIILYFKIKNILTIDLINSVYYLNNKYRSILFFNDIKCLYVYSEELITTLNNYNIYYLSNQEDIILESNNFIINLNYSKLEDIINTIITIYNFRNNYNREINIIKNIDIY